jgi:host factor-I protein
MTSQQESLSRQDEFLDNLVTSKNAVNVFLINGIRLAGVVTAYDRHVIMLDSPSGAQAVYKHAISTVLPNSAGAAPRRTEPSVERSERSNLYRRNTTSY